MKKINSNFGNDVFNQSILDTKNGSETQQACLEMKHFQIGTICNIPSYVVFLDHIDRMIVIGIRGTAELADALINVHMIPKQVDELGKEAYVHEGIYVAAQTLFEHLNPKIAKLIKEYPYYTIKTTGHSLGGATAALVETAGSFASRYFIKDREIGRAHV